MPVLINIKHIGYPEHRTDSDKAERLVKFIFEEMVSKYNPQGNSR